MPTLSRSFTQDGIDYTGDVKSTRFAALLDWHPLSGGVRLTAGLSGGKTSGDFAGTPLHGGRVVQAISVQDGSHRPSLDRAARWSKARGARISAPSASAHR